MEQNDMKQLNKNIITAKKDNEKLIDQLHSEIKAQEKRIAELEKPLHQRIINRIRRRKCTKN